MKLLIIFCVLVIAAVVVGGLIAGFVYGIVKRGRELNEAHELIREIRQQSNLWKNAQQFSSFQEYLNYQQALAVNEAIKNGKANINISTPGQSIIVGAK